MRPAFALTLVTLAALTACQPEDGTAVRATLEDGQVLVGQVTTGTIVLESGLGVMNIPISDVGEVYPVEGGDLEGSGGNVSVWLRNGTELVGKWSDPELAMGVEVGGRTASVNLPVDDLYRFQLQGGTQWPEGENYRVRTTFGDDFLVDPERTRLVIDSTLGEFDPFLSECASANPIGNPTGDWRIELHNGTVLIGPLADDAITFALFMGPTEITVPLDAFTGLERQYWGGQRGWDKSDSTVTSTPQAVDSYESDWEMAAEEMGAGSGATDTGTRKPARQRPAPRKEVVDLPDVDGWFSNKGLRIEREQQYRR